ncbi:MAG TPA: hypothetical protein VKC60_01200 [Opitutaceae bacterium]|nr:hypothetical protein [Opitutaceae bacterium]
MSGHATRKVIVRKRRRPKYWFNIPVMLTIAIIAAVATSSEWRSGNGMRKRQAGSEERADRKITEQEAVSGFLGAQAAGLPQNLQTNDLRSQFEFSVLPRLACLFGNVANPCIKNICGI